MEKFNFKAAIKNKLHETYGVDNIREDEEENPNEGEVTGKYKRLQSILQNDILNHAAIERQAFGKSDGTTRSLFRKKLNRFKDENGGTYAFNDDEISKILSVIQNLGATINKVTNKKDKE